DRNHQRQEEVCGAGQIYSVEAQLIGERSRARSSNVEVNQSSTQNRPAQQWGAQERRAGTQESQTSAASSGNRRNVRQSDRDGRLPETVIAPGREGSIRPKGKAVTVTSSDR